VTKKLKMNRYKNKINKQWIAPKVFISRKYSSEPMPTFSVIRKKKSALKTLHLRILIILIDKLGVAEKERHFSTLTEYAHVLNVEILRSVKRDSDSQG